MSETFAVVPMYFEQSVYILDTAQSSNYETGSLIVYGGVGVQKNLNVQENISVGGNVQVDGNLFVKGELTYINTTTLDIADNTLLINAGPGEARDAGIIIARHPDDVTEGLSMTSGGVQSVYNTGGIINLPSENEEYNGWWVKVSSGSTIYYAQITDTESLGETTQLTFSTKGSTNPLPVGEALLTGDVYLYNRSYFGLYLDEQTDKFVFGYVSDPSDPKVDLESPGMYGDIRFEGGYANTLSADAGITGGSLYVTGPSQLLSDVTTGSLLVSGGSFDVFADNITLNTPSDGSLLINGIDITPNANDIAREQMYMIPVDDDTSVQITNFTFSNLTTRSFEASMSVVIDTGDSSVYALYRLKGLQKGTSGSWYMNSSFIGDLLEMDFSIGSVNGFAQIKYNIGGYPGLISTGSLIKFRASTTSV